MTFSLSMNLSNVFIVSKTVIALQQAIDLMVRKKCEVTSI